MATDKKNEQVASVEERLKALYQLQTILSEIDRIKTIRGELPLEVQDFEDQVAGLQHRIENFTAEIEELQQNLVFENEKINNAKAIIEDHKVKIDNVRNNREFDLLSKEIEYQELEIKLCEKHISEFRKAIEAKNQEIEATHGHLADVKHILAEKKSELDEIVSETRQEEEALKTKAKNLEPKIDEFTLKAFKRIRKNARNGLGIVYVQRNACGGCFNRIPPQKQMEIKMHKKVIVCEYCGRRSEEHTSELQSQR